MGIFSSLFKRNKKEIEEVTKALVFEFPEVQEEIILDLPEDELVQIGNEILDTNDRVNIEKFKHNLAILVAKTKREGKIDKFVLIREDDYFPRDWMWQVASKNTLLEQVNLSLCLEVKLRYALEQKGIKTTMINGLYWPVSREQEMEALKGIDRMLMAIYLPVHFRSTKHFTINTPLGVTGDYNVVNTDRNFIIFDGIDNFLDSGYAYSVAYHDAYLDVSHEPLPISKDAIVLIEKEKYEKIKNNSEIMSQLNDRRVIIFTGDESMAINMVLSEIGVLPSQIGIMYAEYDRELMDIIADSIKDLAYSRGLLYDQSHSASMIGNNGHFTSRFDNINYDYNQAINEFVEFLKSKFPEYEELITYKSVSSSYGSNIVDKIGVNNLVEAIREFNAIVINKFNKRYEEYLADRSKISPEVHDLFVTTVALINKFYQNGGEFESMEEKSKIEDVIKKFFQGDTVQEQLASATIIMEFMNKKNIVLDNDNDIIIKKNG